MNFLLDCHSHSNCSFDADNSVEEMCQRAMELGLKVYAITDHCECNGYYEAEYYGKQPSSYETFGCGAAVEKSIQETRRMQEKLEGRLNLLCGVELGQATFDLEAAEKVAADTRLDYIIGSMHQAPGEYDFYFLDFSKQEMDIPKTILAYYQEVYKLCQWGKFDTLAHLTYPLRYIEGDYGIQVDLKESREVIGEALRLLAQKGKSLEINTSGYRQKYGRPFPTLEYLRMYRELGGEMISLGADAHRTGDVAGGISQGIELAKAAGFRYATYYRERKPQHILLP